MTFDKPLKISLMQGLQRPV